VYIHANDRLLDKINDVDYHETNVEWNDECSSADSSSDSLTLSPILNRRVLQASELMQYCWTMTTSQLMYVTG